MKTLRSEDYTFWLIVQRETEFESGMVAQVVQYRELSEQRLRLFNLFRVHLVSDSGR